MMIRVIFPSDTSPTFDRDFESKISDQTKITTKNNQRMRKFVRYNRTGQKIPRETESKKKNTRSKNFHLAPRVFPMRYVHHNKIVSQIRGISWVSGSKWNQKNGS